MVVGTIKAVVPGLSLESRGTAASVWAVSKQVVARAGAVRVGLYLSSSHALVHHESFLNLKVEDLLFASHADDRAGTGTLTVHIAAVSLMDAFSEADINLKQPVFFLRRIEDSDAVVDVALRWPAESADFSSEAAVRIGGPSITVSPDAKWMSDLLKFAQKANHQSGSRNAASERFRHTTLQSMKSKCDEWADKFMLSNLRPSITIEMASATLRIIPNFNLAPIVASIGRVSVSTSCVVRPEDVSESSAVTGIGPQRDWVTSADTMRVFDSKDATLSMVAAEYLYLAVASDMRITFADEEVLSRFDIELQLLRTIGDVAALIPLQVHFLIENISLSLNRLFCRSVDMMLVDGSLKDVGKEPRDSPSSDEDLVYFDTSSPPTKIYSSHESVISYQKAGSSGKPEEALRQIEEMQREINLLENQASLKGMLNEPRIEHLKNEIGRLKAAYVESLLTVQLNLLEASERTPTNNHHHTGSHAVEFEMYSQCNLSHLLSFKVAKPTPFFREYVFRSCKDNTKTLVSLDAVLSVIRIGFECSSRTWLSLEINELKMGTTWRLNDLKSIVSLSSLSIHQDQEVVVALLGADRHDKFAVFDYTCHFPTMRAVEEKIHLALGVLEVAVSPSILSCVRDLNATIRNKRSPSSPDKDNPPSPRSEFHLRPSESYSLNFSSRFHRSTLEIRNHFGVTAFNLAICKNSFHYSVDHSSIQADLLMQDCLVGIYGQPVMLKPGSDPLLRLLLQSDPTSLQGNIDVPPVIIDLKLNLLADLKVLLDSLIATGDDEMARRSVWRLRNHRANTVMKSPLETLTSFCGFDAGTLRIHMASPRLKLYNGTAQLEAGFDSFRLNYNYGHQCSFGGCALMVAWTGAEATCNGFELLQPLELRVHAVALPPHSFNPNPTTNQASARSDTSTPTDELPTTFSRIPLRRNELQLFINISAVKLSIRPKAVDLIRDAVYIFVKRRDPSLRPISDTDGQNSPVLEQEDSFIGRFLDLGILFAVHTNLQEISIVINSEEDIDRRGKLMFLAQNLGIECQCDLLQPNSSTQHKDNFIRLGCHLTAIQASLYRDIGVDVFFTTTVLNDHWFLFRLAVSSEGDVKTRIEVGATEVTLQRSIVEAIQLLEENRLIHRKPPFPSNVKSHIHPIRTPLKAHKDRNSETVPPASAHEVHLSKQSFLLPLGFRSYRITIHFVKLEFRIPLPNGQCFVQRLGPLQAVSFSQDVNWETLERPFGEAESERCSSFIVNELMVHRIECFIQMETIGDIFRLLDSFPLQISHTLQLSQIESELGDRRHYISLVHFIRVQVARINGTLDCHIFWLRPMVDEVITPIAQAISSVQLTKDAYARSVITSQAVEKSSKPRNLVELMSKCFAYADLRLYATVSSITGVLVSRNNRAGLVLLRLTLSGLQTNFVSLNTVKPRGFFTVIAALEGGGSTYLRTVPLIEPFEITASFTSPPKARIQHLFPLLSRAMTTSFVAPNAALCVSFNLPSTLSFNLNIPIIQNLLAISIDFSSAERVSLFSPLFFINNSCGIDTHFRIAESEDLNFEILTSSQTRSLLTTQAVLNQLLGAPSVTNTLELKIRSSVFKVVLNDFHDVLMESEGQRIRGKWEVQSGPRIFKLSSSIKICSHLGHDLELRGDGALAPWTLTLKAQSEEYLPCFFDRRRSLRLSSIGNSAFVELPFCLEYERHANHVLSLRIPSTGSILNCSAEVKVGTAEMDTVVTLWPTVTVTNLLACSIEVELLRRPTDETEEKIVIAPAQRISSEAFLPESELHLFLKLHLPGRPSLFKACRIDGSTGEEFEVTFLAELLFANGARMNVNVEVEFTNVSRNVTLFVPFWIVSLSRHVISYSYEEPEEESARWNCRDGVAADQFYTRVEVSSLAFGDLFKDRKSVSVAHVGQLNEDLHSARVSLRANESNFSRSFPLAYNGPIAIDVTSAEDRKLRSSILSWIGFNSRYIYS